MSSRPFAIALFTAASVAAVSSISLAQSKATVFAKSGGAPVASAAAAPVQYVVAPTGNEARYRVREQLAGVDLPSDAIGATKDVTGTIAVDPSGAVSSTDSKIVISLKSLKSDKSRRDNYLK
ncbi:MAG TPA: hypothetical protein VGN65_07105, partial [Casimicrobiaceae bacterium]